MLLVRNIYNNLLNNIINRIKSFTAVPPFMPGGMRPQPATIKPRALFLSLMLLIAVLLTACGGSSSPDLAPQSTSTTPTATPTSDDPASAPPPDSESPPVTGQTPETEEIPTPDNTDDPVDTADPTDPVDTTDPTDPVDTTDPVSGKFSVSKTSQPLNKLSVSWTYDDSNPEIAEFKIYDANEKEVCSTTVSEARELSCDFDFIETGDQSFTVTALDIYNNESDHSVPVAANKAPQAVIKADGLDNVVALDAGQSTDFDSGSIVDYTWEFGDGTPVYSGKSIIHEFQPGNYNVMLTVTDNEGATATTNIAISIG